MPQNNIACDGPHAIKAERKKKVVKMEPSGGLAFSLL